MPDLEDLLAGLNDAQREACLALRGPVAILAGAGTGKTTTITHRIACQVRSGAFNPSQILAVTVALAAFTVDKFQERAERWARKARHGGRGLLLPLPLP